MLIASIYLLLVIISYFCLKKDKNIYNNAKYLVVLYNIVLVTSPTHQRRAYNTFKKVIKGDVRNHSTSIFFSYDGILFPTGWVGIIVNAVKDYKYNK